MKNINGKQDVKRKIFYLLLAVLILALIVLIPLPEALSRVRGAELTREGKLALGVLLFALILWITEAIPFHITGLFCLFLLAAFRVDTFVSLVRTGFGNHIIVFFIGVLVLSAFITRSGLGRRISVFILSRTGNSTRMILLGFLVTGTLISMWITDMAVAAMLMPLAVAILKEEGCEPLKSKFGKGLLIATAWGSIIGGIGTPSGAGPNPLVIGFLKEMAGIDLTFPGWMLFGVPSALLLILPCWGVLLLFFPPEMRFLKKSRVDLKKEFKEFPPMDREEKVTLGVFLFTAVTWIATPWLEKISGISIPISMPLVVSVTVFFLPGISSIGWKEVEREISWNSILLIVTGISIGMSLYTTGAAEWLALALLGGIGNVHPFVQVFAVVIIVSILKVTFSSNTVTATIIIPILIALAENLGIPPLVIIIPAGLTSSMAFILVTSTPTNVIPYSAGYFSIRDMALSGTVFTIIGSAVVSISIYVIGLLTGLY